MADYISRDEVLEHSEYTGNFNLVVPVRFIKAMKAAEVQPARHGRWVECCNELDKKCSCCDKVHGTIYEREPFCPNCGARMDGDTNERS